MPRKTARKNKPVTEISLVNEKQTFSTGAVRCKGVAGDEKSKFPLRFALILNNHVGFRRLAETYGEGALKYGDKNWMKGMPESSLLDHALAHIAMHVKGDTSEDHLAHGVWNLFTLMFMQEEKPELMDLTGTIDDGQKKKA